jgi:hypothetical protein
MLEKWAVLLPCDYNGVGDKRWETIFCVVHLPGDGRRIIRGKETKAAEEENGRTPPAM